MAGLLCTTNAHCVVAAVLYRTTATIAGARLPTPLCRTVHLERGRSVLSGGAALADPRSWGHTPRPRASAQRLWAATARRSAGGPQAERFAAAAEGDAAWR